MADDTDKRPKPLQQALALATVKFSGLLPLWLSRWLGVLVGWVGALTRSRAYNTTLRNLELCYPSMQPDRRRRLARQSLCETGKLMLETGAVWQKDQQWLDRHIRQIHGLPLLQAAVAAGRGVILIVPHMGNWEVMGLYLPKIVATTSLYSPPDYAALDSLIRTARAKSGATLVPASKRGVAALLRALRSGHLTAILPDQVPDRQSGAAFAPFFDTPARTMTLVNNLRQSSGAIVLAGCIERVAGGFDVHFLEPADGIYADDEQQALAALNKTVELCVAINPSQYQWEYKRFRRQPDDMPNPYRRG